jgi:hypothetical protein
MLAIRYRIAAGQIGAPDRSGKQHIARKHGLLCVLDKDHVPARVTGRKARLEFQRADFDHLTMRQSHIGRSHRSDLQAK